jgi:hypothetical protein
MEIEKGSAAFELTINGAFAFDGLMMAYMT